MGQGVGVAPLPAPGRDAAELAAGAAGAAEEQIRGLGLRRLQQEGPEMERVRDLDRLVRHRSSGDDSQAGAEAQAAPSSS